MNCRPCLFVFLVIGGFFLLSGLVIFALGVLKLAIRDRAPAEVQTEAEWELFKPSSADDIFSRLIHQNAIFVLVCGLLAIVLAVLILFPGWLCLRHSDRSKRRRQKKFDAESGHIEEGAATTQVTVQVDAHGGIESRPTDPLLTHAGVTAVEVSVNGIPRAVHDDEGSPTSEKEKLDQRYPHDAGVPDGHVRYEVQSGPQVNGHENPMYNLDEEKLRQHASQVATAHSTQQHIYENESQSFHSYSTEPAGLGPVAPVPALAVHRVVEEEDENLDEEEERGDDEQQAEDSEDPPFANENYVYASVKRTDRHSRSPSDESNPKTGPQVETTSPRSSVNGEGRSALLQKAHDLVDEVLRAASDTSTSHSLRMSAEYAAAQDDPYETCDSPIPSVHEEDEILPEDEEAAREAEEEADHRSVTSSEEGDACFNAPTPEISHAANAAILEEDEVEERHEENDRLTGEAGLVIGASDVLHDSYDQHSDNEDVQADGNQIEEEVNQRDSSQIEEEVNQRDSSQIEEEVNQRDSSHMEEEEEVNQRDSSQIEEDVNQRDSSQIEEDVNQRDSSQIEEDVNQRDSSQYEEEEGEVNQRHSNDIDEEEESEPETPPSEYQFEDIPQYGVSEPPPPNIAVVPEEEEEEEEERDEMDETEDTVEDPNANIPAGDEDEPALPAHPMDFGFGPPELIINAPSKEPSVDDEDEEAEESVREQPYEEEHSEEEDVKEEAHEDVNANMAEAALVHISPEDDVEISELLGPQALKGSTHSEEPAVELPPPSSPSPPPPPPDLPGESFMKLDSPEKQEDEVDLLADMSLPAPENSLLADMGIYEGEPATHEDKPPPPAAHEQFGDLVSFDDPEDSSSTPPPPPPPPPPMEGEEGWPTEF